MKATVADQPVATAHTPRRVMLFLDATNLLNQIKTWAEVDFDPHNPPDVAINVANQLVSKVTFLWWRHDILVRRYWCGSFTGSDEAKLAFETKLHARFFSPIIMKKLKSDRSEKGVDMAIAIELLANAFNRNLEIAVLVAGDRDYERLVLEAKRYGPIVVGAFFENKAMSPELRVALDSFFALDEPTDPELRERLRRELTSAPAAPRKGAATQPREDR